MTRLRAAAAQTRDALRELVYLVNAFDLSIDYGTLAKADSVLTGLMTIEHRAVAIEHKPLKRKPKKTPGASDQ